MARNRITAESGEGVVVLYVLFRCYGEALLKIMVQVEFKLNLLMLS